MGRHYPHIKLVIIVQPTYNTCSIEGGRYVWHDASMQYPSSYDIWVIFSCLTILENMCNITLAIKIQIVNVGLTFKPYMFIDTKWKINT
jgi:hypothetical protein